MAQNIKSSFIISLAILLGFVGLGIMLKNSNAPSSQDALAGIAQAVLSADMYPVFECPCCGKSINECTCPMAQERKNYLDALIEVGGQSSEEKIVLAYVKKYGLSSFMDKERGAEFRAELVGQAPKNRPIIVLEPTLYDMGDISQTQEIAVASFVVRNQGKEDLVINKLETSCGCTSASIVYQGEEGPKFNMPGHGINEEIGDWQASIAPNKEAELKVYYDPNFHGEFRGAATREIHIFSNDPIDFETKVSVELNQVD